MYLLILFLLILAFGVFEAPIYFYSIVIFSYLLISNSWVLLSLFVLLHVVLINSDIRKKFLTRPLMNLIENLKLLPKISDTEKTALLAGTTWIEADFFKGKIDFKEIYSHIFRNLSEEEKSFIDNEVEELCNITNDWEIFQNKDLSPKIWKFLKEKKFLGMIIPKEHGGLGFSALGHSMVIEKLVSRSQVLAITTMVPNSLGPAELIMHYGTDLQKEHYLPRLANGTDVPCFALTEPEAGSDATSIQANGILFKNEHGEVKIRLNFQKRYITLAHIATLIGIAFHLKDPEHILGEDTELGITFAVIDAKTKGIDQSQRHDPLGVPFVNSPLWGKDVIIDIDNIIGSYDGIGEGWKMLTASLAVGRGISLPSTSSGASKLALKTVVNYANVREQFGLGIGKFEGIKEPIASMAALTYLQIASKKYVLDALDTGVKPAVINSIMKYHSTENARIVLNHAMDVVGGAGIIKGPKNLLANLYIGIPVSITVEGANILTRNLMQFGQGLIRCHPYLYKEFDALENRDIEAFDESFFSHLKLIFTNSIKAMGLFFTRAYIAPKCNSGIIGRYEQKLAWSSSVFALLSEVVLGLFGGDIKRKENLSALFADSLSWLYLGTASLREYYHNPSEQNLKFSSFTCKLALSKIQYSFEQILLNLLENKALKIFTFPFFLALRLNPISVAPSHKEARELVDLLSNDTDYLDKMCDSIYTPKDENDQLNIITKAAQLMKETKELREKIKVALKNGKLEQKEYSLLLDDAINISIIKEEDKELLLTCNQVRVEAISVDSFNAKSYKEAR
ncbi:acyl-CoA dehydrogenase [Sulfurospirillum arcachonense]|uniref:acyl-CoA dehydrogenase n=1 Tax=Sulfurospirillum arcachonense TaxID=57666 RepID=UPI0004699152|nr:acyl-CoA dehydrogenase [Sulfurospirillum arcachonense]